MTRRELKREAIWWVGLLVQSTRDVGPDFDHLREDGTERSPDEVRVLSEVLDELEEEFGRRGHR